MFKFAIIGCGRIAVRHAENINRVGKLTAVCDIDEEKANSFALKYNAQPFTSITELLHSGIEIDIVVICTPNGYHAEHSIKALDSGRNVLCEKPLCLTTTEAKEIIEAEKRSGRKLFVVKSMRFNPLLQYIKGLINKGELGNVYSFQLSCFWNRPQEYFIDSWHGKKFPDGGTLFTQFSHYIDAMLWLFGPIKEVKGFAFNAAHKNIIEFEDTGVASIKLQNGTLGTLNWSINTYKKNFEIGLIIISEKGTISLGGEYLNEVKLVQLPSELFLVSEHQSFDRSAVSHHKEVYDNLIMALNDDDHSFTNSLDGLKTVDAIEFIYHSISS
jgi:UDP-N-acetyl-2-amino-2-deoxyglucuronate dehydrogenase